VQPAEGGGEEEGEEDTAVADDGADEGDCGAYNDQPGEGECDTEENE